jgi:O-antigen ligase
MLFYFAFYHAIRDVATIRTLFAALLFVTALISLQCIRQGIDYGFGDFSDTHRASGPFAVDYRGANLAAAYFIIFLPQYLGVFLTYRRRLWYKLGAVAGLALGVTAVFVTYSRQAYLILAALFMVQATRKNLLLGAILALVVVSYEAWAPDAVIERIQKTEQVDEATGEQKLDKSTESRFDLWTGAMQLFAERPWGIGLNHFRREIGRFVPEYANFDPHNGFVRVMTEAGLLGLLAFVFLLVKMFFLGRRVELLDNSEDSQLLGKAFSISAIGVAASNLFGSRIFDGEVMGNFWILSALVARYYTLTLEQRRREQQLAQPLNGSPTVTGVVGRVNAARA